MGCVIGAFCKQQFLLQNLNIGVIGIGHGLLAGLIKFVESCLSRETGLTRQRGFQYALCLVDGHFGFGALRGNKVVLGKSVTHRSEHLVVTLQAVIEACPILFGGGEPACFAECQHTGQELVFKLQRIGAGFGPQVTLHTYAIVFASLKRCHGVQHIGFFNGIDVRSTPTSLITFVDVSLVVGHLHKVEVKRLVRHYNALETFIGGLRAVADAIPCHNDGLHLVVGRPVCQQFVPHHEVFIVFIFQEKAQFFNEPRLQFVHTLQTFVFHALQAVGIVCPLVGGTFVATNVDIRIGEHFGNVSEYALQESHRRVFTNVQHIL